jgi:hypothetical protein
MQTPKAQSFADAMKAADNDSITEIEMGQVVLRPDGYHWQAPDGKQEFGPFATMEEALSEMQAADTDDDGGGAEPGESLEEAEDELGMSGWIDPDTGAPAEGFSTPRLHDE